MFRSKPIGWITAGTLFCVAGVALACRLRDGKETTAGANAAVCPVAAVEPDDKADPPKPAETAKSAEKTEKDAPNPLPSLPDVDKKPAVGELVTPAAIASEPKAKTASVPTAAPPSALDTPPPPPSVPAISSPPPVLGSETSAPAPSEKDIAKPTLLPPVAEPIRPVSASEDKGGVTTAAVPPSQSSPEKAEKKEEKKATIGTPPDSVGPPPSPAATIPSKEEASSPPPPTTPSAVPVAPSTPPDSSPPMPSPSPASVKPSAPGTPLYRVRGKGESLREIANRTLGSGERWPEIYRLNPDLQPELMVPSGKVVLLPAEAKVDAVKGDGPMEGGQAESEHMGPSKPGVTAVRPLPVVRPHRPQVSEKSIAPLTGTYSCQLDNRSLVMPKEVAEQLGKVETMLLTPGPDRCLWLGTQASVARVLDRVEKSGASDHEVQAFRRLYFAQTEKATVNDAGKMMLPEKLAEYAGLGKEVVLVGIDDHFELWDATRWQHYSQQKEPSLKP